MTPHSAVAKKSTWLYLSVHTSNVDIGWDPEFINIHVDVASSEYDEVSQLISEI